MVASGILLIDALVLENTHVQTGSQGLAQFGGPGYMVLANIAAQYQRFGGLRKRVARQYPLRLGDRPPPVVARTH